MISCSCPKLCVYYCPSHSECRQNLFNIHNCFQNAIHIRQMGFALERESLLPKGRGWKGSSVGIALWMLGARGEILNPENKNLGSEFNSRDKGRDTWISQLWEGNWARHLADWLSHLRKRTLLACLWMKAPTIPGLQAFSYSIHLSKKRRGGGDVFLTKF